MINSGKRRWLDSLFEFDENISKTDNNEKCTEEEKSTNAKELTPQKSCPKSYNVSSKDWMKTFDPKTVEDLAVHTKKIQEVEQWLKSVSNSNRPDMLLITGPVGCGKTITLLTLATKYNFKVTEWVTPVDIDIPNDFGFTEFKEKQSKKFLEFIINAANFTSLLNSNENKLVLVEDFPNIFLKNPLEFNSILEQYRSRGKSPIVFICSEMHSESKSSAMSLFNPQVKEMFNIHHISLNSVSVTGLKSALKRVADIINKKYSSVYKTPSAELIDCVVNSSAGDVRSAVLNLHFACLKGSHHDLETSQIIEKENKSKGTKRKKKSSNKYSNIGKDLTVSILHGVGRVLNPKVIKVGDEEKLSHSPNEVIEQFLTQPNSFVNFLHENYLSHFSCVEHLQHAAGALSDADLLLSEWRGERCQECGLFVAVAGLMLSNKTPVSSWNPVRGPKNMRVIYPKAADFPILEQNYLYRGKDLVTDYKTYCQIISKVN